MPDSLLNQVGKKANISSRVDIVIASCCKTSTSAMTKHLESSQKTTINFQLKNFDRGRGKSISHFSIETETG
jgi:hypothetical protein